MTKSIFTKILLPLCIGAFVLAGCSKDEDAGAGGATVLSSNETILRYVPADTPYVIASVEPLPDDLMDKMEPKIGRLLTAYQTILREAVAAKRREAEEDGRGEDGAEQLQAFVDELAGMLSVQGLRDAGIGRDATGAIYGVGLLPVARLDQVDGKLLDATISRLEAKAGHKLPVASIEGGGYRYIESDEGRIILAVFADQLVVTVAPKGFGDEQISQLLGLTLPETSIADAGTLENIASEYGFTPHYAGFIDSQAIAAAFVDPPAGLNADLMALTGHDGTMMSDVCKTEIRAMAAAAPRLVMGYNDVGVERIDSTIVLELRDDLAAGLAALSSPVPGLGSDHGGLVSFGFGIDVKAAREFVEARVAAIQAEPFECEFFSGLQAGAAGAQQGLQQPLPPMVYDFKGFVAVVSELEGLDVATQTPPTSMEGSFMLAMDNAQALISMGAMFSPELAALDLQPNGKPVALDMPQIQAMGISAHAAMTESAIAITVGESSASGVDALLNASVADEAPFMSISMDVGRYYAFIGEAISAAPQDDAGGPTPEMKSALQEVMSAVGDLYDRMTFNVSFTSRGVEIRTDVTLQD